MADEGKDDEAKQAYVAALRLDPTHLGALVELGSLAYATGHLGAARTAYGQAARHHPDNAVAQVNLARLLFEDGATLAAKSHYQAALAIDPDLVEAHQGLARVLTELGDEAAAGHWQKGFAGHATTTIRHRGAGPGLPLLLLVSARGGNIPTASLMLDRHFSVTALYADFYDPAQPLPPHALVLNAIADADACMAALNGAEALLAQSTAPVINPPAIIKPTGRADIARRLAAIPGLTVPRIGLLPRDRLREPGAAPEGLEFPLLLRSPGFHTGQHFVLAETADMLPDAAAGLLGDEVLTIQYLDARGPDGMARKYRVMMIGGALYPVHLAITADWKVHYYTTDMAHQPAHRDEEQRFLTDMAGVLGPVAMRALAEIDQALGLDYGGVDFALAPDGTILLFEANAAMVIAMPDADPVWDYRRPAITAALNATTRLLLTRSGATPG